MHGKRLIKIEPGWTNPPNRPNSFKRVQLVTSQESITKMKLDSHAGGNNKIHFGNDLVPIRLHAAEIGWLTPGSGWSVQREGDVGDQSLSVDGWLIEWPATPEFVAAALASGLPVVLAAADMADSASESVSAVLVDAADGYVLPGDDAETVAAVIMATVAPVGLRVADSTLQIINALSADASRIATQLAALAELRQEATGLQRPIDAALVRRLLRARRDRARFLPADLFADPAWDMLLDLMAARLEGRQEPVSSLCIAANVPTTTALRWVRSLTDAGLIERQADPFDARRSHVRLTDAAADGVLGWLRLFSEQFTLR